MAYNSSGGSSSDFDMDMLEESEDELNITTYFNDDMELSSTDNDSYEGKSLEDGGRKESLEAVDGKEKLGDVDEAPIILFPVDMVEGGTETDSLTVVVKKEKFSLEDDYTEVPMDIVSPTETKKNHLILCPVCYEIAILCKNSTLYDNLIFACMEQRSTEL
ncbi:uncharacterized protein LOC119073894 [Bradysia coprophila]|uniref:uncharacterized protein LOC119073894 n=1 Tax=Bradysia coprophila TaxID=38358 RepID=UPI00187DB54D|nr:uncharacterized protein LOC119073894 [Bradysia coprophila]